MLHTRKRHLAVTVISFVASSRVRVLFAVCLQWKYLPLTKDQVLQIIVFFFSFPVCCLNGLYFFGCATLRGIVDKRARLLFTRPGFCVMFLLLLGALCSTLYKYYIQWHFGTVTMVLLVLLVLLWLL